MVCVYKQQSGVAMLLIVVIISVVLLLTIKTVSFLGISNVEMAGIFDKGDNVLVFSEGCVEEALRRIQIDNSYTVSNFPLSIGSESCIISVEDNIGQKIITIVGNTDNYYKKIRVIISIVGEEIAIQSWEELTE
ncbi:hypothetical protein A2331_03595 [Candidatus Falkowbacteria bacterium RIFOXYB2_FULL_34_18]|uniref:Type 4 fimbrial biogenesis protein PilX N-terminal domain-containing protein n=1 Tax=Candidatus Falkowbacteria bacterium RIFOXYD2_FULL_34_120 TaxID=1798007 RepID=A0A1F5TS96_9BACT|nr:MAG: hypothetical protein A2331_03595 [Candidatus Falkowbacteria bacterium RIFOXYB2_FULL_34_18]OGF30095.1 MAG: hypothetical protein A2500_04855 [Candidatus Falkowbacteria bacterium RIFOXYC12_FULL_34_55]OGF37571.1 MAG: hypothetical protein A2466_01990 [Candidatus Falkowbacteria bacterium RIFOXYC2_FULL_34_220]OGF39327.1 MAG: hypothetical protein A2515_02405 [Candidatus Falkowbacteria bacterium RIFOXYD12_FULL_34_57]OGF41832.1 MAG: hypothetical protein A2531_05390 [Candidatus Falkowbacteria bact